MLLALGLGLAGCASGPKPEMDASSREFYETARLIMSGEEKDIFSHLPDAESQAEFIREFWIKRDPDLETPENEFREEFARRLAHVQQRFKEGGRGWNSDRGRIYIYLGEPDRVEEFSPSEIDGRENRGRILWWVYYRYHLGFQFIDKSDMGHYVLDKFEGEFALALKQAELGYLGQTSGEGLKVLDFDFRYDRGRGLGTLSLPVKAFSFKAEGEQLKAELDITLYLYGIGRPARQKILRRAALSKPESEVVSLKTLDFDVPLDVPPGNYYFDIIVTSTGVLNKTRKIFKIKV